MKNPYCCFLFEMHMVKLGTEKYINQDTAQLFKSSLWEDVKVLKRIGVYPWAVLVIWALLSFHLVLLAGWGCGLLITTSHMQLHLPSLNQLPQLIYAFIVIDSLILTYPMPLCSHNLLQCSSSMSLRSLIFITRSTIHCT